MKRRPIFEPTRSLTQLRPRPHHHSSRRNRPRRPISTGRFINFGRGRTDGNEPTAIHALRGRAVRSPSCRPGGWSGGKALASAAPLWTTRRATADDAAELASVFNAHTAAGICPYSDRIAAWGSAEALAYLEALNGSVLVEMDGTVRCWLGSDPRNVWKSWRSATIVRQFSG